MIMKISFLTLLILCTVSHSYAKNSISYSCKFDGGSTEIFYDKNEATVNISYNKLNPTYHHCKVTNDEFGKLVDCNTGNRDFMILISNGENTKSGGVMSKTLNLFEDLNC